MTDVFYEGFSRVALGKRNVHKHVLYVAKFIYKFIYLVVRYSPLCAMGLSFHATVTQYGDQADCLFSLVI